MHSIGCAWASPCPLPAKAALGGLCFVPEETDIPEDAWVSAAAVSPAFGFLKEAAEDIYTTADGKPFHDQG